MLEERQTPEQISLVYEQLWQSVVQFGNLSAMQERNRIARDLHDSLGQALTALNIQLQTAIKLWQLDPAQAQLFLEEAARLGSTAIKEVRQSVSALRGSHENQTLDTLIDSLAADFHRVTGVLPKTVIDLSAPLPTEVITPLYRIVQEALNNICKYAQATEVQIQLRTTAERVYLIIQDNGRGFELSQNSSGFGLQGMRERVAILRGHLHLETAPGAGCWIEVEVPLKQLPPLESGEIRLFSSTIPVIAGTVAFPHLVLTPEQSTCLEKTLVEFIGPIAPTLLQQVLIQVQDCKELVEKLALRVSLQQRVEFEQKLAFLLEPLPVARNQAIDESFISECERELTAAIGPIAPLLVQQILKAFPQVSLIKFTEILTAKITDAHKAVEFRQHLLDKLEG